MIFLKRLGDNGVEFAALSDRESAELISLLRTGWVAEHVDDNELILEIIKGGTDDVLPEHALAVSNVDLGDVISRISEEYDTEGGDVFNWLRNEVMRKVYFALLEWGDGGMFIGQTARYNNAAGFNVVIDYKEGWTI